jgi:hypothetical protein
MTTLSDVLGFIASNATQDDIARIHDAANTRTRTLRTIRAASVDVGSAVKIVNIKPKALAGLTGTVQSHNGKHATVLLDERSTTTLRFSRVKSAGYVAADVTQHPFGGIPLSCLEIQE